MAPLLRNPRPKTELSPQLSISANYRSFSRFPFVTLISNVALPPVPRLEKHLLSTQSEGLFSVTVELCALKEAICSSWRM